jgi:hypothetical protein
MIKIVHIADLKVIVGDPIEVGETPAGIRRMIPILGGEVSGPRLKGHVMNGGADYQILRKDGVTELDARYVLELEGGAKVYVTNSGLRHGPPELMERIRRGEPVDPALIYFRATPRFETGHQNYAWLTRHIFVCDGVRRPNRVELAFYQVL